jgi:predicted nucleic acid-binding protein
MRYRFVTLDFQAPDEVAARQLLTKYQEHRIRFHDALCSVVMIRHGIYRIFTFDSDFGCWAFKWFPGSLGQPAERCRL